MGRAKRHKTQLSDFPVSIWLYGRGKQARREETSGILPGGRSPGKSERRNLWATVAVGEVVEEEAFTEAAIAHREVVKVEECHDLTCEQSPGHDNVRAGWLQADDPPAFG